MDKIWNMLLSLLLSQYSVLSLTYAYRLIKVYKITLSGLKINKVPKSLLLLRNIPEDQKDPIIISMAQNSEY